MNRFLLIAVAAALSLTRFFITPRLNVPTAEGSYEAIAHLFVGFCFGAWLTSIPRCFPSFRELSRDIGWRCLAGLLWRDSDRFILGCGLGPSLLELVVFVVQKVQSSI